MKTCSIYEICTVSVRIVKVAGVSDRWHCTTILSNLRPEVVKYYQLRVFVARWTFVRVSWRETGYWRKIFLKLTPYPWISTRFPRLACESRSFDKISREYHSRRRNARTGRLTRTMRMLKVDGREATIEMFLFGDVTLGRASTNRNKETAHKVKLSHYKF